jgi:GAF domain-containing protein
MLLGLLDTSRHTLVVVRSEGMSERTRKYLAEPVLLDDSMPATRVLRRGQPVYWTRIAERDRDYPEFADYPSDHESWAIQPLSVRQVALGVLVLGWRERRHLGAADQALLSAIAHQCALAVDRSRLDAARRAERETLELLSEGTRLMVSALDPERVLASLVRLAVPRLAPWCAVYVAEGDRLRRVAIEIEEDRVLADELRRAGSIDAGADVPIAEAYRRGELRIVEDVGEDVVRRVYGDPLVARIIAAQGGPSQLTSLNVPIRAGGEVIGVMSLVSGAWRGEPGAEVLFAAEGLAGRAGVALRNAQRYERERETAALLTQALLPPLLPRIAGYDLAATYRPAGSKVAGDWYDVARLPSGRYLIGVGDAGGHGITAASLMAQLRNGARALAFDGQPPGRVLASLTSLAAEQDPASFATALYAVLDPEAGTLSWASCGHLPPLLSHSGATCFLRRAALPPLGWPAARDAPEHELALDPGDVLVLVTDGVVERRDRGLEDGMETLRRAVAGHGRLPAAELAEHVAGAMGTPPDDDACVVVLARLSDGHPGGSRDRGGAGAG